MSEKISAKHLVRPAILYVRQSSTHQVLHNEESRRLQYAMKQRLRTLGWKDVDVIDEDQGRSASTTAERTGFQRMVADVCLGNVGAVAAREVSRFARNNRDWHQLIEMCSHVDTLLVDHEAIYNPRESNDRLLLGLKGSLSEYELDLLRQRSLEARWAKARRGELLILAPVGYLKTRDQRLEMNPDQRVQHAIQTVFEKFFELGSARQTLLWFLENGLEIPSLRYGVAGWETHWKRPAYRSILRILKDPTYAGAYSYGRTGVVTRVCEGSLEKSRVRKPMEEWGVLIRDQHEPYITWDRFERIQMMLAKNVSNFSTDGPGAAKKGSALLAGLLRCRRCGRKLLVNYTGNNRAVPRYCCIRGRLDNGERKCISFGGTTVDAAISREVLRVLEPGAVDAALLAANADARKQGDLLEALLVELKAARYGAERAQKQFDAVDPENRLVADELERRWNETLMRVRDLEVRIDAEQRTRREQQALPAQESLLELAADLESVWDHPDTDVRLQKRLLRTLIKEIIVDIDEEASEVVFVIHWKGGIHSELRTRKRRRGQSSAHAPMQTIEAIRCLALVCTDDVIASYLNRNGVRTGRGNRWTRERVTSFRNHHKILRCDRERQRQAGWLNLGEAAAYVHVAPKTLRRAAERGEVPAKHPLPYGPWVFQRSDLDATRRTRAGASPAVPTSSQLILDIPTT